MVKARLIYITGISGSGKSTACRELKRRGYTAYDTDSDEVAHFFNKKTGRAIHRRLTAEERTPEWRHEHVWKARREDVEKLIKSSSGTIFLCGVTANDADDLWDLFSKVFALTVSGEILERRIAEREEDSYGKNQHELDSIRQWQRTAEADYKKLGAILIDASRPVEKVVDTILLHTKGE